MSHTPTPWEFTEGDIWIDTRQQVCCLRGYHECCGEPEVIGGQELVAQTSPDNAALIVKAVNAHDVLVSALNAIAHTFMENSQGGTTALPAYEYQRMAREALAKTGAL